MTVFRQLSSLILFGQILSLIRLHAAFNRLNQITSQTGFNEFHAKTATADFERHEEMLLYGTTLTVDQRERRYQLFELMPDDHENNVHQLFIGRYIEKDGSVIQYPLFERILFLFGWIALATTIAATAKIGIEVALSPQSLAPKIGFIFTLLVVLGVPMHHLHGRYLAPAYTYLKHLYKL